MRRVEQQMIEKRHPQFRASDEMAFASKNLWNLANYHVRQSFIFQQHYLTHTATVHLLVFELGSIWKAELRGREIAVSQLGRIGETKQQPQTVRQVRIVPQADHFVLEVIYDAKEQLAQGLDPDLLVALDPGINVLAALTSNKPTFVPQLVSGKPVRAVNQLYNKHREHEQKQLAKGKDPQHTSHRLERITTKRNRRVMHDLHTASRRIVELLVEEGIGVLVVGKNVCWKTSVELGKKHNQELVPMPHAQFLAMLTYKAEARGIRVIVTEESYTSQASFLDGDCLPVYGTPGPAPVFSGQRVKRGLYRAAAGTPINADVNGAYNIIRTVAPEAFAQGSSGCVVHPVRLAA